MNATPSFDRKIHDIAATWRISKQACSEASVRAAREITSNLGREVGKGSSLQRKNFHHRNAGREYLHTTGQKTGFIEESRHGYCLIMQVFKKNRSFSKSRRPMTLLSPLREGRTDQGCTKHRAERSQVPTLAVSVWMLAMYLQSPCDQLGWTRSGHVQGLGIVLNKFPFTVTVPKSDSEMVTPRIAM